MNEIKGYSRFVARLKILLPLGGCALLLGVIIWPIVSTQDETPLTDVDSTSPAIIENRMIKPRYASTDQDGRPFEVEAEWGKPTENQEEADLITPKGKITTNQHGDVTVNAEHGHYDKNTKVLQLNKNVVLETDDGYHMTTERADVDMQTKTVESTLPTQGYGPTGQFRSDHGFQIEETKDGNRILKLKGHSQVVINAQALKKVNDK